MNIFENLDNNSLIDLLSGVEAILEDPGLDDSERSMHELHQHQIELEIQNQNLRETQEELEASRQRYLELYDYAPVGMLNLDAAGIVKQVNLTACKMLGISRKKILGFALTSFIGTEKSSALQYYLRKTCLSNEAVFYDFEYARDNQCFQFRLLSSEYDNSSECRLALIDLSRQYSAQLELIQAGE